MDKQVLRPAWAEINLSNLDHNIKCIKAHVGDDTRIIGIIKADGYGHGSVEVANVLLENGITSFGVAALSEVIKLREAGITEEIIMLGLTPDMYADAIIEYNVTPVICDYANAKAISDAAKKAGTIVSGFIAIDTGMGRIGYQTEDQSAIAAIKKIERLSNVKIKALFSHFATADAADKAYAREQERRYNDFYERLTAAGVQVPMRTFANSAAIMELPSVHFDAVRPGIILYGCYPSDEVDRQIIPLKPVMSVKANIVHLKTLPKGSSVSYGRKYRATRDSLIATLTLGYADGYPRPFSTKAKVIVNGVMAPVAGNICMDQCMIDVTDVLGVKVGDEVIIMGSDGQNTILADDLGDGTGTINYEIVCAFGQRLPKVYVREEA
jgi:alanine racemase